jgi:hypothetical protein
MLIYATTPWRPAPTATPAKHKLQNKKNRNLQPKKLPCHDRIMKSKTCMPDRNGWTLLSKTDKLRRIERSETASTTSSSLVNK